MQYSGALFPAGDFTRLSELDRQRLVFFLHWAANPEFVGGPDLLLLINPVKSEVSGKVASLRCSYPRLLPPRLREMEESEIAERVEKLKWSLRR